MLNDQGFHEIKKYLNKSNLLKVSFATYYAFKIAVNGLFSQLFGNHNVLVAILYNFFNLISFGPLAQLVERSALNRKVRGSNPLGLSFYFYSFFKWWFIF